MAEQRVRTGHWLILAVAFLALPVASQDRVPEAEFLEYLGSWDDGDEQDWIDLANDAGIDVDETESEAAGIDVSIDGNAAGDEDGQTG